MTTGRILAISAAFSGMLLPALASAQAIQGFGRAVPFGTAARQIVPADMLLDIDRGVDSGGRVNWSGGTDWHVVLEQLAASRNARVSYDGQLVHIQKDGVPTMAPLQTSNSTASLNRGGLVVLAERTPPAPIALQFAPSAPAAIPFIQASPAPIALQPSTAPTSEKVAVVPTMQQPPLAPIVLKSMTPVASVTRPTVAVSTPPIVVVEPAQSGSATETKETPRQKAERLRAERVADKEMRMQSTPVVTREPAIRNAQPTQRQPINSGVWRASKGESLDHVLLDWGDRAGWSVVYNSQIIYDIQSGAEFTGEFTEVAASLVRSVQARPVPTIVFYRGNKTLVISNNVDGN